MNPPPLPEKRKKEIGRKGGKLEEKGRSQ